MRTAIVVIGAGFGDEGKGLTTDYFASQSADLPLVVRFNGGAQAGHTVEGPSGERHVFSHFCAASLQGAVTGLSRFFACHPILFHREWDELAMLGIAPQVIVDPQAPITTPYEVMINQALESSRGGKRHGSCGMGFGETIEREENSAFSLCASDLLEPEQFRARLRRIRDSYTPSRLVSLGLPPVLEHLHDETIFERFILDAMTFAERVCIEDIATASRRQSVIYEGAQGLQLDMDLGHFPHVTRSNTGLKNVTALALEAGIGKLDSCYVTRAYVSRHGAGPLDNELESAPYRCIVDTTNVNNNWQGKLRFAWLDLEVLRRFIHADLGNAKGIEVSPALMVTCLDQVDPFVTILEDGKPKKLPRDTLPDFLAEKIRAERHLASYGPCRHDVALGETGKHARVANAACT